MTSVSGSPAGHVTVANTSQSALNVRDPEESGWEQPRHPDDQQEDPSPLTCQGLGQRSQEQVDQDDDGE